MHTIIRIAQEFAIQGVSCYYVGGAVRDEIMNLPVDDVDICLVGVTNKDVVKEVIGKYATSFQEEVGANFPVWKATIEGQSIDFALARTERKAGNIRTQFLVSTSNVTIVEDLYRRDFSINAIAKNILSGDMIDPFGGYGHIKSRILHPVSEAFKEDSLRVLRGARFCARFSDFHPDWDYYRMAGELVPTDLSNERVGMELMKVMKTCPVPSNFFTVLYKAGWLQYHFSELANLIGCPQDPTHHPEGDAFVHTLHTINQAKDWFTRTVMLCHDLGKMENTLVDGKWWKNTGAEGKITSVDHQITSARLTKDLLKRIHLCSHEDINKISILAKHHMLRSPVSTKVIRRTLRELHANDISYDQLVEVIRCDVSGRPPLKGYTPDIGQKEAAKYLSQLAPIVTGDKLIELGLTEGKDLGIIKKKALELQDRGSLNATNWKMVLRGLNYPSLKGKI